MFAEMLHSAMRCLPVTPHENTELLVMTVDSGQWTVGSVLYVDTPARYYPIYRHVICMQNFYGFNK